MARITDAPPPFVTADLAALRQSLDEVVPAKRLDRNLLVATWNLRAFGGLTEDWQAGPDASPKRDLWSLLTITEIVSRFDVVAVQEVRGNIKALRHMLKALGPDWSFILTDVTKGTAGNDERMAFVFDARRVKPSGLAAELVLPPEWGGQAIDERARTRQFARTPYAVSFASIGRGYSATFILVTLHVLFGSKSADRVHELEAIAQWLAAEARDINAYDQNLIALGDFNIDRVGDPNYEAFVSTGLRIQPSSRLCLAPSSAGMTPAATTTKWRGSPVSRGHPHCPCATQTTAAVSTSWTRLSRAWVSIDRAFPGKSPITTRSGWSSWSSRTTTFPCQADRHNTTFGSHPCLCRNFAFERGLTT